MKAVNLNRNLTTNSSFEDSRYKGMYKKENSRRPSHEDCMMLEANVHVLQTCCGGAMSAMSEINFTLSEIINNQY